MVGLVERRLSNSAIWCRRLAMFALPFFLLVIYFHRSGAITSNQVVGLLVFGFILLVVSILLAMNAISRLWNEGAKGGRAMITGLFMSLSMIIPFMIFAVYAMRYPTINDISTNVDTPPSFSAKALSMRKALSVPQYNNPQAGFNEDEENSILTAYPKVLPRRYPAGPERVFEAVKSIVVERSWKITDIRGLPTDAPAKDTAESSGEAKTDKDKPGAENSVGLEAIKFDDISIDAVASSRIFSFKNDVVILIVSEEENTLVEMRSAARWGVHDFGANARFIEEFLHDLDQNLLGIAGEG